ncbi:MAG: hypothetical protein Q7P63_10005 [Verrucomicrobiota bacterium JB022]|nr:hypothetical protein [Verrucomicrobiota bacterium JB022]
MITTVETGTQQGYRIAYEAFAQLSAKLNKLHRLEEVQACLARNLKYLFSFRLLRVVFNYERRWILSETQPGESYIGPYPSGSLLKLERQLYEHGLPVVLGGEALLPHAADLQQPAEELHELWGWVFGEEHNRRIMIMLAPGPSYQITHKDVVIIRLLAEVLEAKLMEVCLFDEVAEKNRRIETMVRTQSQIIKLQTKDLEEKNHKLLEILSINAHHMREPLTRIMGLLSLLQSDPAMVEELLPMLKVSSQDLDETLQNVIRIADTELSKPAPNAT